MRLDSWRRLPAVLLLLIGGASTSLAGPPRRVDVPRLEVAPVIDGQFAEGEWDGATRLSDFTQLEPVEGQPATEPTVAFIARDDANLYVAFHAYDSAPDQIRATRVPRDKVPATDDSVALFVDPFRTRTRCFTFVFNPLGVHNDGVWSQAIDPSWDTVVVSRGSLRADGFIVEAAIPLTSLLGGGSGEPTWDVNFARAVARKGEEIWWAPLQRARINQMLADFATLEGMDDARGGSHVELIPTALARTTTADDRDVSVGLTALVPVAQAGRFEATYRPDFSEVESDVGQITFNERYALFYPEKRPFFLEGKDQFETPVAGDISDPIQLVHTRTLVRTRYGVRWLSAPGPIFVGGLVTAQDRSDGSGDGTAGIVRASRRWAGNSQAGVTLTRRTRMDRANTVMAADARLQLPASSTLTLQVARSHDAASGGAPATGALAGYADFAREDSRSLEQVVVRVVPRDFDTDVGFLSRTDLRQVISHAGVYRRPGHGRLLYVLPMMQHVISLDDHGDLVDNQYLPHLELQFTRQTQLWVGYRITDEVYRGHRYRADRFEPRVKTAPLRWMTLSLRARVGSRLRYDRVDADADGSFVAPFREIEANASVTIRRNLTMTGYLVGQAYGAGPAMPRARVWLGRGQVAYQFDNLTYVRSILQWDADTREREFSLLAARVLNYGTQLHTGVEYHADDQAPGHATGAASPRWAAFVRLSYLLRR